MILSGAGFYGAGVCACRGEIKLETGERRGPFEDGSHHNHFFGSRALRWGSCARLAATAVEIANSLAGTGALRLCQRHLDSRFRS
jgi:hypothetical protein